MPSTDNIYRGGKKRKAKKGECPESEDGYYFRRDNGEFVREPTASDFQGPGPLRDAKAYAAQLLRKIKLPPVTSEARAQTDNLGKPAGFKINGSGDGNLTTNLDPNQKAKG